MYILYYKDKRYTVNRIGDTWLCKVSAYDRTVVKDGYLYNFFSQYGWNDDTMFHAKVKIRKDDSGYYLNVRDQQVRVTERTLAKFHFSESTLAEAKDGAVCKIGKVEFIKVQDTAYGTLVMLKKAAFSSDFGETNDFGRSKILAKLQKVTLPKVERELGEKNLREFTTDLTSYTSRNMYIDITTKISLPTHRQLSNICNNFYGSEKGYWLATAYEKGYELYADSTNSLSSSPISDTHDVHPVITLNPLLLVITKG